MSAITIDSLHLSIEMIAMQGIESGRNDFSHLKRSKDEACFVILKCATGFAKEAGGSLGVTFFPVVTWMSAIINSWIESSGSFGLTLENASLRVLIEHHGNPDENGCCTKFSRWKISGGLTYWHWISKQFSQRKKDAPRLITSTIVFNAHRKERNKHMIDRCGYSPYCKKLLLDRLFTKNIWRDIPTPNNVSPSAGNQNHHSKLKLLYSLSNTTAMDQTDPAPTKDVALAPVPWC